MQECKECTGFKIEVYLEMEVYFCPSCGRDMRTKKERPADQSKGADKNNQMNYTKNMEDLSMDQITKLLQLCMDAGEREMMLEFRYSGNLNAFEVWHFGRLETGKACAIKYFRYIGRDDAEKLGEAIEYLESLLEGGGS